MKSKTIRRHRRVNGAHLKRSRPKPKAIEKPAPIAAPPANTAHGRTRLAGVKSLRWYLRMQGRGAEGRAAREAFAKRIPTTLPYLQHLVLGNRQASMEMAAKIEAATHGVVKGEDLHPSPAWQLLREVAAKSATQQGGQ